MYPELLVQLEPATVEVGGLMGGGRVGHRRPGFLEVVA